MPINNCVSRKASYSNVIDNRPAYGICHLSDRFYEFRNSLTPETIRVFHKRSLGIWFLPHRVIVKVNSDNLCAYEPSANIVFQIRIRDFCRCKPPIQELLALSAAMIFYAVYFFSVINRCRIPIFDTRPFGLYNRPFLQSAFPVLPQNPSYCLRIKAFYPDKVG